MNPLALTDRQMWLIRKGAAALPVTARDEFLRQVTARLTLEPSDAAVAAAVNVVLDSAAVAFKLGDH
jgi:hypothetical protein